MVEAADDILFDYKCEALSTLFIYVILERGRQKRMANAILQALKARRMVTWNYIRPYTPILFCGPNTPSMNSLIILSSPYIGWDDTYHNKDDVIRWAAAALTVPYTEEVGQDVVGALLQISMYDSLRPHVPLEIWTWLKKHSTLPPLHNGLYLQITNSTVHYIRGLGDIEIFKSFLLLAWSEHNYIRDGDEDSMKVLLREDFCGIGMWGHRKDLIERLDRVVGSCDLLDGHSSLSDSYKGLMDVLLEVEIETVKTLTRMSPKLSFFYQYADSRKRGHTQNPAPSSPVLCPSPARDLSPHVVNVWLQRSVLVLPPRPVRSHHISLLSKLLCSHIWIRLRAIITVFAT